MSKKNPEVTDTVEVYKSLSGVSVDVVTYDDGGVEVTITKDGEPEGVDMEDIDDNDELPRDVKVAAAVALRTLEAVYGEEEN
jgi:hypothetical protein